MIEGTRVGKPQVLAYDSYSYFFTTPTITELQWKAEPASSLEEKLLLHATDTLKSPVMVRC